MALPTFTHADETTALAARYTPVPTGGRLYGLDRFVKQVKRSGAWDNLEAAWCFRAGAEANGLLNIVADENNATKVSTPTFTANRGISTDANTKYVDTGFNPVTENVDVTSFHIAAYTTGTVNAASDLGLYSAPNGISLNVATASGAVAFRANGAQVSTTATGIANGEGFVLVSVKDGVYSVYVNGDLKETGAYTTAALVDLSLHVLHVNGATSYSGRTVCYVSIGKALTATQVKKYHCAVQAYMDNFLGGWPAIVEAGYAPDTVTADLVVYGTTFQGIIAAREAKRQGLDVVLCGGYMDFVGNLAGMTGCGLGATDYDTIDAIGGLPRLVITRTNSLMGEAADNKNLNPRHTQQICRSLLDSGKADGAAIPIYFSTGVDTVTKTGSRITEFTTVDGRTFYCDQAIDCSYEGDLAARAGCTFLIGREAAGSGYEAHNGWRGVTVQDGGRRSQFFLTEGTFDGGGTLLTGGPYYDVDPYVTPGDAGSGCIEGVATMPADAEGAADSRIMSYSFRATMSKNPWHRSAVPATAPTGYTKAHCESFLRFLKKLDDDGKTYGEANDFAIGRLGGTAGGTRTLFSPVQLPDLSWDFNTYNGFGPNMYDGSHWSYPEATYSERKTIWRNHIRHLKWLWYIMAHGRTVELDDRVPAAMETDAQLWGFHSMSYCDQHDDFVDEDCWHIPPQLYVRECRRLRGMLIYDGNDLSHYYNEEPEPTLHPIGCASYKVDSHIVGAFADPNGGSPRIWNCGMLSVDVTGTADMSPIPYEAICPRRGDVTNILVPFCASATHVAFTSIRMEFPCATLAQAAGIAAAIAIENGCDVQDVPYSTLRTRLLAAKSLVDETDPVIPLGKRLALVTHEGAPVLHDGDPVTAIV